MSQHALTIANQAGASFRADLVSALQALGSLSSGAGAPATMYSYQLWADTASGILKQRNAANSAWINIMTLATAYSLGAAATADVASAAAIDLTGVTGRVSRVTGSVPTSEFTMNVGQWHVCIAAGAWVLNYHSANNKLNTGGGNYTCAEGDRVLVVKDNSGTIQATIYKADGSATTILSADTATKGAVELATYTEVRDGLSGLLAVTPVSIKDALGFSAWYDSGDQTITLGGALALAHGLGRSPVLINVTLKCMTAEAGFVVGDVLDVPVFSDEGSVLWGMSITRSSTTIGVRFAAGSGTYIYAVPHKTDGSRAVLTPANWKLVIRAWG